MREFIQIGTTPEEEECAQVGISDEVQFKREAIAFRAQIFRENTNLHPSVGIEVRAFEHDRGMHFRPLETGWYHELVLTYPSDNDDARNAAFKLADNLPQEWDFEAKQQIGLIEQDDF